MKFLGKRPVPTGAAANATTRQRGNAGFLMYLADSAGYLGYAVFILAKLVVRPDGDFIRFFYFVGAFLVALATLAFVIAWWDFCQRHPKSSHRQPLGTPVPGR